jgi:hypothetical protein
MLSDLRESGLQDALDKFKASVIKQARTNLTKGRAPFGSHNNTRKLYNSLKGQAKVYAKGYSLSFEMEDYGFYQDKGVRGKRSNSRAPKSPYKFGSGTGAKGGLTEGIQRWVKARKFQFRQRDPETKKSTGKFLSYDATAWIITRSIYAKGLRPTLFFTKPFEAAYKRLPQELVNDLKIDLEKIFNYSIKQPK